MPKGCCFICNKPIAMSAILCGQYCRRAVVGYLGTAKSAVHVAEDNRYWDYMIQSGETGGLAAFLSGKLSRSETLPLQTYS